MYFFVSLIFLFCVSSIFMMDNEKEMFCKKVESCIDTRNKTICGIRSNGTGYQVKTFANECELLKFGCAVKNEEEG